MMELRPYQKEAIKAVKDGWNEYQHELLVLPTGTGKTVVFSQIAKDMSNFGRVLIMAHRDELIEQARDKYKSLTGDNTAKEKASDTCIGSNYPVVVGSVQTLQNERRLNRFDSDYFKTIIVDEAHHSLSDSYQRVLQHFSNSRVLGVTATPDRGDKRSLGRYYDNIAYQYSLKDAVRDGYLCNLTAKTIPLKIDMSKTKIKVGDFEVNSIAETLEPYLPELAKQIALNAGDRKTVVFMPLISIAQEFCELLKKEGLNAKEVNGQSANRKETIEWFDKAGKGSVLCNAMLLTEGWDCPSVDCVVVLRPTKIRSLYVQMIGRGTRLSPGKDNLLILDFLWMSQKHDLCIPADLAADNVEDKKYVTEKSTDEEIELFGVASDAVEARRNKLAEELSKQKNKKAKLVDPLNFFISIADMDLVDYEPNFKWESEPATNKQIQMLERNGINAFGMSKGKASMIIDRVIKRSEMHLSTAKQIATLEKFGYENVGEWSFDQASRRLSQLAAVGWKKWKLNY